MDEAGMQQAVAQMMKLHGPKAVRAASRKADAMLAIGNIDAFYAWNRITAAISDLDRKAAPSP